MDLGAFAADSSTSILEALQLYEKDGFSGQFRVTDDATVECLSCRQAKRPEDFDFLRACRIEGTSDPDDEAIVLALVCPACAAKGTLVVPYGPEAPQADAEVLKRLHDARTASGAAP